MTCRALVFFKFSLFFFNFTFFLCFSSSFCTFFSFFFFQQAAWLEVGDFGPARFGWHSTLTGDASAAAASSLCSLSRGTATVHLVSITISSFWLNLPIMDLDLTLTIHLPKPNLVPPSYSSPTTGPTSAPPAFGLVPRPPCPARSSTPT